MMGRIEEVRDSKSGKTLSVKVGGTWYTTKNWEFRNMIGHEIVFEGAPWTPPDGGKPIIWINEYQDGAASTTPAGQAMDAAMDSYTVGHTARADYRPTPPVEAYEAPQNTPNKDAMIGAFALVKACPNASPEVTWQNFEYFYGKLLDWKPVTF